jgi:ABC-2 type transport system ATP-binding protein
MSHPIISVKNLVKRYGDFAAIDNITFSVDEGEFFGFLGPNGAGKTTTMRVLSTLLKKTSGEVMVAGIDVDKEPDRVRHSIGFALQTISLDNLASGWENLQLLGVLYGLSPAQAKVRAGELLEVVGLTKVADKWVTSYSGGMRRRLDLAGVLMHSPKVIFLDEPTEGLDPQARRTIWDYLRKLNQEGSTIFMTTHYMDEADALCRRLAFIDKGKIIKDGTPASLKAELGGDVITLQFSSSEAAATAEQVIQKETKKATVSVKEHQVIVTAPHADQLIAPLVTALNEQKLAPSSLVLSQPSLEDVFVRLVGRSILQDDTSQLVKGIDPFVQGAQ